MLFSLLTYRPLPLFGKSIFLYPPITPVSTTLSCLVLLINVKKYRFNKLDREYHAFDTVAGNTILVEVNRGKGLADLFGRDKSVCCGGDTPLPPPPRFFWKPRLF